MKKVLLLTLVFALLIPSFMMAEEKKDELPSWVKKFKISADARLRYHIESKDIDMQAEDGTITEDLSLSRARGRMRFRIKMKFNPSKKLQLVARVRTKNITMGKDNFNGGGSSETVTAHFDHYYFLAKPWDFLSIRGGSFDSPFEDSTFIVDTYYRFTGLAEDLHYKFGNTNVSLKLGQIFMGKPAWIDGDDDDKEAFWSWNEYHYLAIGKLEATHKINALKLNAGVAYYDHTGLKTVGMVGNDYNILNPHLKVTYSLAKGMPISLYFEYAQNLSPDENNTGFQAGLKLGKTKKEGSFDIQGYYRSVEKEAVFAPLTMPDLAGLQTNVDGFFLQAKYAMTDYWILQTKFWMGSAKDEDLQAFNGDGEKTKSYSNLHLNTIFKF